MKKRSLWSKVGGFLLGKGFYMVLLLCVMAIGGSGYYLYSLAHTGLVTPPQTVSAPAEVEVETVKPVQPTEAPAGNRQRVREEITQILPTEAPTQTPTQAPTQAPTAPPTEQAAKTSAPAEAAEPVQETGFCAPVDGKAVAVFSASELTYNPALGDWRTHNGVDLSAELGEGVYAARDGEVLSVTHDLLLGTTVTLNHGDGLMSVYANLAEQPEVEQGERVNAGEMIGTVGQTALGEQNEGAWLHFAVLKDGVPVDPMAYLDGGQK